MPESVAKDDGKKKEASPRRRPTGNTAHVRVELLDGSTMELDVDVSAAFAAENDFLIVCLLTNHSIEIPITLGIH